MMPAGGGGTAARNQAKLVLEGILDLWGDDGLDITASVRAGYPVQAHHCICCSVAQSNNGTKMAKLMVKAGYDINNGKNNIFLPAKFGHMRLNNEQRHRGGHWEKYYNFVDKKLNPIYKAYKDTDPCKDDKARANIIGDLMALQASIKSKLESRKLWLYSWSQTLYTKDYREEGTGPLTSKNQQSGRAAGLAWVELYPKGKARRKTRSDGKVRKSWYSSKGFPVPGSVKT